MGLFDIFSGGKMLRSALSAALRTGIQSRTLQPTQVAGARLMSSRAAETDAEFDARFEAYFNRPNIDGWELRKGMHDLTVWTWSRSPRLSPPPSAPAGGSTTTPSPPDSSRSSSTSADPRRRRFGHTWSRNCGRPLTNLVFYCQKKWDTTNQS